MSVKNKGEEHGGRFTHLHVNGTGNWTNIVNKSADSFFSDLTFLMHQGASHRVQVKLESHSTVTWVCNFLLSTKGTRVLNSILQNGYFFCTIFQKRSYKTQTMEGHSRIAKN